MENLQPDPPLNETQLGLVARLTHEQLRHNICARQSSTFAH